MWSVPWARAAQEKRAYLIFSLRSSRKVREEFKEGRDLEVVPEAETVEQLSLSFRTVLVYFLIALEHLYRVLGSAVDLALLHQLFIKEMQHRLAYRPVLWKHFLILSFFFQNDSSLCHIDQRSNQDSTLKPYKEMNCHRFKTPAKVTDITAC